MAAWPTTLPQAFEQEGYSEEPPDTILRSKPEMGPPKVRRRYTAGTETISGTMTMDRTQWLALRNFFLSTCAGGSISFDWAHPSTGALIKCRFLAPPAASSLQVQVKVKLQFEVLP